MTAGDDSRLDTTGVVLAGGRARRMGGEDKGLIRLNGRAMVSYVVESLREQVGALLVNANRNASQYEQLAECPVIADRVGDFAGPLAGMASAMESAKTRYILTVPCDSPLIAPDLSARLHRAQADAGAEISVAHDGERLQPVFALLDCHLLSSLLAYLDAGERKIDRWYDQHHTVHADLSDRPDMFLNINTPQERSALEARLS